MRKYVGLVLLLVVLVCVSCVPKQETVVVTELRDFKNVEQLEAWLVKDNTDSYTYVEGVRQCCWFAHTLQENAAKDGYLINEEFLVFDDGEGHACDSVVINGVVWFIEPQTDEVWEAGMCSCIMVEDGVVFAIENAT